MTYDELVGGGLETIVDALNTHRGGWSWGDIAHFAWTAHKRSLAWILWDIQGRSGDEPDIVVDAPVVEPEPPSAPLPEPEPTPTPPAVGFATWPGDLLAIRTNHTARRHPTSEAPLGTYWGVTEAPGRPDALQREYIRAMVADGYQHCWFNLVNGATTDGEQWPASIRPEWRTLSPYDGLGFSDADGWIQQLVSARIVPVIGFPFQGAPRSWQAILNRGYTNEWFRDHIGTIAHRYWEMTEGHCLFVLGFEMDKKWGAAGQGDGPGDRFGFNGMDQYIARPLKRAVPQAKVFVHLLPNRMGPEGRPDGDRDWTPDSYWTSMADGRSLDGLFGQYDLDGSGRTDGYFRDQTRRFVDFCHRHGKRFYAAEFTRPDTFAAEADRIREICLSAGTDGVVN